VKRLIFILATSFLATSLFGQGLFVPQESTLYVSPEAFLTAQSNAVFVGDFVNDGRFYSYGGVDFRSNEQVGYVSVKGNAEQLMMGETLQFSSLEIDKNGRLEVYASKAHIHDSLLLKSGILSVLNTDLVVTSGKVGNSGQSSFVEGLLQVVPSESGSLHFPVGVAEVYQGISLEVGSQDTVKVEAMVPVSSEMIPGDSLIGVADQVVWIVSHAGLGDLNANITLDYNNVDFENFPVSRPIRANNYAPVVVAYVPKKESYRSLRLGDGSSTLAPSGRISSQNSIHIKDSSVLIAVGVTPIADGLNFYLPTVFTPGGGQQVNRKFRPFLVGTEVEQMTLIVWDKYNREVFRQQVQDVSLVHIGWDGDYPDHTHAPQGVYYYSVEVVTGIEVYEKTGSVLLVR
jgi:hypothetical protein